MGKVYRSNQKAVPRSVRKLFDEHLEHEHHLELAFQMKTVQKDGRVLTTGIGNRSKADRCDELIPPEAWDLENYLKNPIFLLEHDRDKPIGYCTSIEAKKDVGLVYEAIIGDSDLADLTDDQKKARSLLKQNILRMNSVGFIPHVIEYDEDLDLIRYIKVELLEISLVAIPMQQDSAVTSVKSRGHDMSKKKEEGDTTEPKPEMEAVMSALGEVKDMCGKIMSALDSMKSANPPKEGEDEEEAKKLKAELATSKAALATLQKTHDELVKESEELLKTLEETDAGE